MLLVTGLALGWIACDTAPGPRSIDARLPRVTNLTLAPDTVRAAALPPDRLVGGRAAIDLQVAVTARDPDGTIDRVLVFINPSYGTEPGARAQLQPLGGERYGVSGLYSVPAGQRNVFTVRVFAIDRDSLTSNQVLGQIQFFPDTTAATP